MVRMRIPAIVCNLPSNGKARMGGAGPVLVVFIVATATAAIFVAAAAFGSASRHDVHGAVG